MQRKIGELVADVVDTVFGHIAGDNALLGFFPFQASAVIAVIKILIVKQFFSFACEVFILNADGFTTAFLVFFILTVEDFGCALTSAMDNGVGQRMHLSAAFLLIDGRALVQKVQSCFKGRTPVDPAAVVAFPDFDTKVAIERGVAFRRRTSCGKAENGLASKPHVTCEFVVGRGRIGKGSVRILRCCAEFS